MSYESGDKDFSNWSRGLNGGGPQSKSAPCLDLVSMGLLQMDI